MACSSSTARPLTRFVWLLALVLLSGVAFATQILEVGSDTLTSYLADKTSVQDAKPLHMQRGVSLDGGLREGSTFPLSIAGNPYERAWRGEWKHNDVQLDTGTWSPTQVDLSLPAPGFRWTIGRTYNVRQDHSGQYDSDGYQGVNWFQTSQPELVLYDAEEDEDDVLYLVWGANRYAEFQRTGSGSDLYKGKNGAAGVIEFDEDTGGEDTFIYHDQSGYDYEFFAFEGDPAAYHGQLWTIEDTTTTNTNKAYVGSETKATAISSGVGYGGSGEILKAYDSADRRYTYSYTSVDGTDRLTEVKAETKTGGDWHDTPTGVAEVGKVEYGYYTSSDSNGDSGDLRTVKVTLPLTDSGINEVRVQYYRYWEGTYNATTNPGYPHHVMLMLDWEGARKYDYAGDSTFDDDFLTETTANLKPYAAAYFEYDTSHRVNEAWFSGQCGCGGAGAGTHEYTFETNASYSDDTGYDTEWARRTLVERPDGSYLTQYFDETGQALSRVQSDIIPSSDDPVPNIWVDHVTRDSSGIVTSVGTPASVASYTHGAPTPGAITTESSTGLIWVYDRVSSGNATGFLSDRKYKTGSSGSAYFDRSYTWNTSTGEREVPASSGVYVRRPFIASDRVYSQAITTGDTGSYLTSYTPTVYSTNKNAVESITQSNPAVSSGNNGSGSATQVKTHYREDGRVDFVGRTDGTNRIITYSAYTDGQRTTHTEDADTSSLSPPSGYETSGSTALDEETTIAYDEQGRMVSRTHPSDRLETQYHTTLKDRRLVTLSYPWYDSSNTRYYGPVTYTVRNHVGKVEIQGVISHSLGYTETAQTSHIDETDDDPITAVDTGSVAQMRTYHYDEAGTQLEEERAYFSIPSSEPGTDGTHYDPTTYGYDDSGRKRRVKEAHGTITRIVYDCLGRQTARWIGTCDSTWSGGEAGTDDMVKVEESVYDSTYAGGNSLVTTRTLFVEASTTNQRQTTYEHDVRGNVLLATTPQAPYLFYKYDNMDRVIAVGGFSSTASITAASDDPTTETTNRVSLSQTFYDELGRVWKSQRHKIDVSDGSDDDNLQTQSWYDAYGWLVKRDGNQLEKWEHDRMGRQTHHFTLANHNDTAYGDCDDVSGDVVLVEDQTIYESGDVVAQARIERLHDDYGASENTGALDGDAGRRTFDTNASLNLDGRIQISAMWYDNLDRLADRAELGTHEGTDFDLDNYSSAPARSDTVLRTTYTYNTDGTLKEVEDPKGIKTRTEYDALGRRTKVIANYTDGTPGGGTYTDEDQTVAYEYTNGLQTKITADLPGAGGDQDTVYDYGTTKGSSSGDSNIGTGHLLQKVTYPDSESGTDVVTFAYNAQGQQIWKTDQSGNQFDIDYDTAGRETDRRVTILDGDFDGAVRRISRTYNSRGLPELVTQYDAATGGNVVDEVKSSYNSWGLLSTFEQDINSAVGAGGSVDDYEVSYVWAKATGGRNTLRRSSMTLPSGNVISFSYRSTAYLHDADASRVTQLTDGGTALVTYNYNGLDTVVGTTLDEPDVMWKQYGTTSGSYPDLDIFNRVTTSKWTKDLGTDRDFYDVDLAYDRNSNISSATDNVHAGFDVLYTNEDLNRLVRAEEGTLSGGSISSRTRDQQWTLTQVGNWDVDKVDLNGDGDFVDTDEVNDDRTHNDVNELTGRDTDDNGTDDFTLDYDEAGNLIDDGENYTYEWDAFYRLRKIKDRSTSDLVAEYKYNGLGFRISIHEDTDDDGDVDASDKWFHHAFDERWRWVATFREDDSDPKEEFLHHAAGLDGRGTGSYIDLVILRDRDINSGWTSEADGTLEERIYYCQNWRADVSALVTDGGQMLEWVKYSAYGVPWGLPGGDTDSDGDCDATDVNQVYTWEEGTIYDVRGDIDLDGDVDSTDASTISSNYSGITLGRGELSDQVGADNTRSFGGWRAGRGQGTNQELRHRSFRDDLGVWLSRDMELLSQGENKYVYCSSSPLTRLDPEGLDDIARPMGPGLSSPRVYTWHLPFPPPIGPKSPPVWSPGGCKNYGNTVVGSLPKLSCNGSAAYVLDHFVLAYGQGADPVAAILDCNQMLFDAHAKGVSEICRPCKHQGAGFQRPCPVQFWEYKLNYHASVTQSWSGYCSECWLMMNLYVVCECPCEGEEGWHGF